MDARWGVYGPVFYLMRAFVLRIGRYKDSGWLLQRPEVCCLHVVWCIRVVATW